MQENALKMSCVKWRPFGIDLNVLMIVILVYISSNLLHRSPRTSTLHQSINTFKYTRLTQQTQSREADILNGGTNTEVNFSHNCALCLSKSELFIRFEITLCWYVFPWPMITECNDLCCLKIFRLLGHVILILECYYTCSCVYSAGSLRRIKCSIFERHFVSYRQMFHCLFKFLYANNRKAWNICITCPPFVRGIQRWLVNCG